MCFAVDPRAMPDWRPLPTESPKQVEVFQPAPSPLERKPTAVYNGVMVNTLASRKVRRVPALVLLPCLLLMGAAVYLAPAPEGSADSLSAPAPAQLVRAPVLRLAAPVGHSPVAEPVVGWVVLQEWVVRESGEHGEPVVVLRSASQPSHLSRAPPASA
jgi:hypothetical protein